MKILFCNMLPSNKATCGLFAKMIFFGRGLFKGAYSEVGGLFEDVRYFYASTPPNRALLRGQLLNNNTPVNPNRKDIKHSLKSIYVPTGPCFAIATCY